MAIIRINDNTLFIESGYKISAILASWLKLNLAKLKLEESNNILDRIENTWKQKHKSKIEIEEVVNENVKYSFLLVYEYEWKVINTSDYVLEVDKFEQKLQEIENLNIGGDDDMFQSDKIKAVTELHNLDKCFMQFIDKNKSFNSKQMNQFSSRLKKVINLIDNQGSIISGLLADEAMENK